MAGCFIAGTLVSTAVGMTPIEQIKPGDQVWSYDQQHEQWVLEEVLDTQSREYDGDMVTLHLDVGDGTSEDISCTGNHRSG